MVTWMKLKYRSRKRAGKNSSSHNDSFKKRKKYSGSRTTVLYDPKQHVMVLQANGKTRMVHYDTYDPFIPEPVKLPPITEWGEH